VNVADRTAALPPKPVVKPSTKMKQFNWTKIPNNKVISSYWKDVTEVNIDLDPSEVERLFAAKEAVKKGTDHARSLAASSSYTCVCVRAFAQSQCDTEATADAGDGAAKKKEAVVTLIDTKRANNCGIPHTPTALDALDARLTSLLSSDHACSVQVQQRRHQEGHPQTRRERPQR
jgi:hypothetical protein